MVRLPDSSCLEKKSPSVSVTATRNTSEVIAPGATIGMLGGGQLGRMFASAARQFGYGVQVFGDLPDSPAGQLSDRVWTATFDDQQQLRQFAERVQVVTYEQENIPLQTLQTLEPLVAVRPGARLLQAAQHRLLEKSSLRSIGIPTADFFRITSPQELAQRVAEFGGSGILKTVTLGYDGKGQARITPESSLPAVWSSLGVAEAILEREIQFTHEISVVAARFLDGQVVAYQPALNHHVNHILDVSVSPSPLIAERTAAQATEMAAAILEHFDAVGVLCVEFFVTASGDLLVNEIAPRPHNSGHLTIDACLCSQFEQQLRAVCGLPSGDVRQLRPAAMINLLGDHLLDVTPERWRAVFARPGVAVHLYGKAEARRGRKMGHLTVVADTAAAAEAEARAARALLMGQAAAAD